MAVFSILSEKPQPALSQAIEREFPGEHYRWNDTVTFVRTPGTAARPVAQRLGIKTRNEQGEIEGEIGGAFVMNQSASYFGWASTALWDWLKAAFEAPDA